MPELRAGTLADLEDELDAYCGDELEWTVLGQSVRIGVDGTRPVNGSTYWEGKIADDGGDLIVVVPPRSDLLDLFEPGN